MPPNYSILIERRLANMTMDELANLSRLDDADELVDDLAISFGRSEAIDHRRYNDVDITSELQKLHTSVSGR